MLKKILIASKYFFIAIGVISSAIILYIALTVMMGNRSQNSEPEDRLPVEIYSTDNSGINLKVTKDYFNDGRLLVSIAREGQKIVNDYELPTKQYGLDELTITDAKVVPLKDNEYGIVIFSSDEKCDHCGNGSQIWLLKLNAKMTFIKMLPLLDVHKLGGDSIHILASRLIQLPYLEETPSEQIVIPVDINIGRKIKITPMLDKKSIALFKQHFGEIINGRLEKLSVSDNPNLLEKYKASSAEFNESLSPQVISY